MITQLSAKHHFGAMHTADNTDGKVTNRVLLSTESEKVRALRKSTVFSCKRCHGVRRLLSVIGSIHFNVKIQLVSLTYFNFLI